MPIYEYKCIECGEKFELMRNFSNDDTDIKCPKCGEEHPQKEVSLFASSGNSDSDCAPSPSGG